MTVAAKKRAMTVSVIYDADDDMVMMIGLVDHCDIVSDRPRHLRHCLGTCQGRRFDSTIAYVRDSGAMKSFDLCSSTS